MRSVLYEGAVWHERTNPPYRLEHRVFYLGLDLAEVDEAAQKLPIFGHNRFNLLSLRDADYAVLSEPGPRAQLAEWTEEAGWRSGLVTIPRILGSRPRNATRTHASATSTAISASMSARTSTRRTATRRSATCSSST